MFIIISQLGFQKNSILTNSWKGKRYQYKLNCTVPFAVNQVSLTLLFRD